MEPLYRGHIGTLETVFELAEKKGAILKLPPSFGSNNLEI